MTKKNTLRKRIPGQYSRVFLLFKRTERLIAALYLVSDIVTPSDPIRNQIRSKAIALLSYTIESNSESPNGSLNPDIFSQGFSNRLLELLSLIEVSSAAGLISEMNSQVLSQEIDELAKASTLMNETEVLSVLNPRNAEKGDRSDQYLNNIFHMAVRTNRGHFKGHDKRQKDRKDFVKDTVKSSDILRSYQSSADSSGSEHKVVRPDRRVAILELLRDRNGLTIKDFSSVIKDCSEKTIQRELVDLVKVNVLKKEGERRWSKYFLIAKSV